MKRIAFYVNNARLSQIDYKSLHNGNPGIGGTPYQIILIATELSKRNNGIDVTLFVDKNGVFYEGLHVVKVNNCMEAINKADKDNYDYIIINSMYINWDRFDFKIIKSNLKIIPWSHNFNKYNWNKVFAREPKIARFISVSREQLDLLRDHSVFDKGDYIFNAVPLDPSLYRTTTMKSIKNRNHSVVFIGSLNWGKSFHILASIWPDIIKNVPDAELYVIGSGNLYDRNTNLSKFGIASEPYESIFMKYLSTSAGEVMPNVHFLGKMGLEKYEVLREAKVAVPNPKGSGETFCISAVEMQFMGCNVTSMEAPGYFDTVYNGILTKTKTSLKKSIIELLLSDKPIKDYNETITYLKDKFSLDSVVKDWERLLLGDMKNHIHPVEPIKNSQYKLKYLKELIRKSNNSAFIKRCLPSISYFQNKYSYLADMVNKLSHYKVMKYVIKNKLEGKSAQI